VASSVAELVDAVRSGEAKAVEFVAAALARAEESQPSINAFTLIDHHGAMSRAEAIDRIVTAGGDPGPLGGVPVAVKDLIDQRGLPTTNGAAFEPRIPDRSASAVDRLEAAGAVIVGRNGLHEWAYGFTSENEHFGPVRNPWDPALSPGGSSGGSGAAVAAGVVPVSIGTDTGGSVRVPAALCGVVGLKTTHGLVPLDGVTPLAPSLDTVGPLGRSVSDVAEAFAVLAASPGYRPVGPVDPAALRIGVPDQWTAGPMDMVTRQAFDAALESIAGAGAIVERVDAPGLAVTEVAAAAVSVEIVEVHRDRWPDHADRYGREVADRLRAAATVPKGYAEEVKAWDATVRVSLDELFGTFDVLATPTVGSTRKVIGRPDIDLDGEAVFHRSVLSAYTWPVNRAGNPALAMPIAGAGTPPASLQLIGPPLAEPRLLGIGLGLEDAGLIRVERPPIYF
jgi:Asp-tRNA(Asn)/Glu-tRNA(Gln) amidotransferase A subunit family amidase